MGYFICQKMRAIAQGKGVFTRFFGFEQKMLKGLKRVVKPFPARGSNEKIWHQVAVNKGKAQGAGEVFKTARAFGKYFERKFNMGRRAKGKAFIRPH